MTLTKVGTTDEGAAVYCLTVPVPIGSPNVYPNVYFFVVSKDGNSVTALK